MVPLRDKNQHYTPEQLLEEVVSRSQKAYAEKRILTHCLIVYTRANAILSKVLDDFRYCEALDEISGMYLNLYYAESRNVEEEYVKTDSVTKDGALLSQLITPMSGFNIYTDKGSYNKAIRIIKKTIDVDIDDFDPILLFFSMNDEQIENPFLVQIEESSVEQTFLDLNKITKTVRNATKEVTEENYGNSAEIFDLVRTSLTTYKLIRGAKKIIKNPLTGLLLSFKL